MRLLKTTIFSCLFSLSSSVSAELIDNGTYVTDDISGMDWLKLSQTVGLSWDYVVTYDLIGYIGDGWTVASQAELTELALNDRSARTLLQDGTNAKWVYTNDDVYLGQPGLPDNIWVDFWLSPRLYLGGLQRWSASEGRDNAAVALVRTSDPAD